jgi:thioredoxin reductase (NADPH)
MFDIQLAKKTQTNETQEVVSSGPKKEIKEKYDVIIVGAGGAGYTSAIYSARYNLKTLIIGEELGGQMNIDYEVENYPGFKKIIGRDLMTKFEEHAKDLGTEVVMDKVENVEKLDNQFKITTLSSIYYTTSVIVALGTKRRKLNIPGEKEFTARGVSYCSTCDGAFYKDKTIAVIGGGDSAFASAQILLQHAKKVYIIHRRGEFRAKPGVVDQMKNNPNVEFVMSANLTEILGDSKVTKIKLDTNQEIELDGIFVDVGVIPQTELPKKMNLELDKSGYIQVNPKQETNVEGIYAAGDATTESNGTKQLVTAAAEGAIAATSVFEHNRKCKHRLPNGNCDN